MKSKSAFHPGVSMVVRELKRQHVKEHVKLQWFVSRHPPPGKWLRQTGRNSVCQTVNYEQRPVSQ